MATFDEFYRSLPEDSNKRGEYFEKVFIPWFLKTDPVWSSKVNQVWLWDDYPQRWGKNNRLSGSPVRWAFGRIPVGSPPPRWRTPSSKLLTDQRRQLRCRQRGSSCWPSTSSSSCRSRRFPTRITSQFVGDLGLAKPAQWKWWVLSLGVPGCTQVHPSPLPIRSIAIRELYPSHPTFSTLCV